MALGAKNVQSTNGRHTSGFFSNLLLHTLKRGRPRRFVLFGRLGGVEPGSGQFRNGKELSVATEHDVGTTSGHVGGDRHGTEATGLRNDGGFTCVVLRVEHFVTNSLLSEQFRQVLALLDARGTHQDGLTECVTLGDVASDHLKLDDLVLVDNVRVVLTNHGPVGRNRNDADLVRAHELASLGFGRTGHTRELLVHAEVVLQGHGRESLILRLDLHALLGLDGLVNTLVVTTAGKNTTGVFVDDEHLAVHHDVVFVALEERHRLDRVVQKRDEWGVRRLVQVVDAEVVFDLLDARLEHTDGALLLVDLIVFAFDQGLRDVRKLAEPAVCLARRRPGNDERGACFVDQNRVDLVDDGEVVSALHAIRRLPRHVVAKVVETKFVVGAVGNVGHVLLTALFRGLARENHAGRHAECAVDATHQLALVAREVVIHGDDVNPTARNGVEVRRERCHQRLTLTGLHLGDIAEVQSGATHKLHIEVTQSDGAASRFPNGREGLRKHVVERFTFGKTFAELGRLTTKFFVGQVRKALFERVDGSRVAFQFAERATLTDAEDFVENVGHVPDLLKGIITGQNKPDGRFET